MMLRSPAGPGLALAIATSFLGLACGGSTVVGSDRSTADAWLVWTNDEGVARTVWLAADGTVRGAADGVVVARGDQLYRLTPQTVEVAVTPCEAGDGAAAAATAPTSGDDGGSGTGAEPAAAPVAGSATRLVLEPVTGDGEPIEIVAAPSPEAGGDDDLQVAEHQHGASVIAGLGPYLFVTESTYVYSCGAHGFSAAAASTVETDTGKPVNLVTGIDVEAARGRARVQLAEARVDGDLLDATDTTSPVELGASVPAWTATRGLVMKHLFWIETCYACSDGSWSSYSRGTWVEDPALPLVFGLMPSVPPAVVAALLAMPEPRGVSWAKAGAAWATAMPAPR
jgi:hypothetical protein